MNRYLCWVALLAVVTLPDWASAHWFRWGARSDYYHSYGYSHPVYPLYPAYPVYPMYAPPAECVCPPVAVQPMNPPRVEAVPKAAPGGMGTNTPRDQTPSAVRPAGGSDNAVSPAAPMTPTTPAPKKSDPSALLNEPAPLPKFTPPEPRKDVGFPKLDVPKTPDFSPIPVPKEMPKNPSTAVPSAAPAPNPEPLIPSPGVPELPDPNKPAGPALTLPPVSPVAPKETISRSSPLTGERREMTVSVYLAGGPILASGYKTVGFYNHTDRELSLTIEGQSVKLPAKNYLHAKLGPTFTWSHGSNAEVREAVPVGASGVDVVFRE